MHLEPLVVGFVLCASSLVQAFSFTYGTPTQCDNLNVSWTGGQPPFRLLIIPPGGTTRNISIPSTAFNSLNNQGSFSAQLALPKNQKFLLSMSDATGITAGGTSGVLTVGDSYSGQICNTTDPGVDFFFSLDAPLNQCQPYPFTEFNGAALPITVFGYIPSGESFVLHPPPTYSYNWMANVAAGTSIVFSMIDSQNRIGGSSDVMVVLRTADTSCLSGSPSSTNGPVPTGATTTGASSTSTGTAGPASSSKISTGIIAGIAAGGAIFLAVLGAIALFCVRRKRHELPYRPSRKAHAIDLTYDPVGGPAPEPANFLLPGHYEPTPFYAPLQSQQSQPREFQSYPQNPQPYSSDSQAYPYIPPGPYSRNSQHYSRDSQMSATSGSFNQRSSNTPASLDPLLTGASTTSGAVGGYSDHLSRVIVHTDIEETVPPTEDDVLELPPQYSDRRTPLSGFASLDVPSVSGSSVSGTSSSPRGKGGKHG